MLKKSYVPLLLISALLVGCEENTNKTEPPSKNDSDSVKKKEDPIPLEGWEQHALASQWYQNVVIPSEDSYIEMIDFEGDAIPELFIGYNGLNYGYIIGKYNGKEKVWEEWSAAHYETPTYGAISYKNSLIGTDKKAIALITNFSAGASDSLEVLHLLKVSEDGEKMISGKADRPYEGSDLLVDTASNSFTIQVKNDAEHFTICDHVVSSEYRTAKLYTGYPILQKEELKKLFNHHFFSTNITFDDTFPIAQHIAGKSDKEDYYEGGFCSFYAYFSFCLAEEGVPVEN